MYVKSPSCGPQCVHFVLYLDVRMARVAGPPLTAATLLLAVREELGVTQDGMLLSVVHQSYCWLLLKTLLCVL